MLPSSCHNRDDPCLRVIINIVFLFVVSYLTGTDRMGFFHECSQSEDGVSSSSLQVFKGEQRQETNTMIQEALMKYLQNYHQLSAEEKE